MICSRCYFQDGKKILKTLKKAEKISPANYSSFAVLLSMSHGKSFMNFNRENFFKFYRREFGLLNQNQVDGLSFLLSKRESDQRWDDLRHTAYALATIHHETAFTLQPIQEFGSTPYFESRYGYKTKKGAELGNTQPGDGAKFAA